MQYKGALILEGGGMRGVYTAGILDYFLEHDIEFTSVYGVSAGALNASNYVSRQRGRSITTFTRFLGDPRYAGPKYMARNGNYFNTEFVYDEIPNKIIPFDYETFRKNDTKFYAVVANISTGLPEYMRVTDLEKEMHIVQASASLPILSTPVIIDGQMYLDGGICDSIPLKRSQMDGNTKNVIILTQDRNFVKKPASDLKMSKALYGKKYPEFYRAHENRHNMYNEQTRYVFENEELGNAFVIAPEKPVDIDRLENSAAKMWKWYAIGYEDAKRNHEAMVRYLEK